MDDSPTGIRDSLGDFNHGHRGKMGRGSGLAGNKQPKNAPRLGFCPLSSDLLRNFTHDSDAVICFLYLSIDKDDCTVSYGFYCSGGVVRATLEA